jgi:hypothetical protein
LLTIPFSLKFAPQGEESRTIHVFGSVKMVTISFVVSSSYLCKPEAVIAQSVTAWMIGVLGFDSRRGLAIFPFTTTSRTVGLTQPPIKWVPGALSLGVKRPRREADHSPPSNAQVKEWVELYLHSPNTLSWRSTQLRHRDNLRLQAMRSDTITSFASTVQEFVLLNWKKDGAPFSWNTGTQVPYLSSSPLTHIRICETRKEAISFSESNARNWIVVS